MDRIRIAGIRVGGRHGVSAQERAAEQPFDVDLVIELDASAAAERDDLAETVDYARLYDRVCAVVSGNSFALLERLASAILEVALDDPRVVAAEVTVAKPGVLAGATPSVTMARTNERAL